MLVLPQITILLFRTLAISLKIFTLEGDQEQVHRFVIGYNAIRSLIVQEEKAIQK